MPDARADDPPAILPRMSRRLCPLLALLSSWSLFAACAPPSLSDGGVREDDAGAADLDAGPEDTGYPAPRSDLVQRVGRDDAIDIASWNIEYFPQSGTTASVVADLITSLDLDVVAVQEISDTAAFDELVARLPKHKGALSPHTYGDGTYQKVGFLYREDLVTLTNVTTIFQGSGYELPRPPLQATLKVIGTDVELTIINVHLKAGLDDEDIARRASSIEILAGHVNSQVDGPADDEVILIGDFNETVTNPFGRDVLSPILDDATFVFQTEALAMSGTATFLPADVMLDHIVTTTALDDELAGSGGPKVPDLEAQLTTYRGNVSDHLPVVISLPVP